MSNRRAEVLNKYLTTLSHLGFTKEDEKVQHVLNEIEQELGLKVIQEESLVKNKDKALIITIKDVSGSVGRWERERFKEYYQLAISEISKKYKDISELFITHNTEANEVTKEVFFGVNHLAGGTIVSSALRKVFEHLETECEVIVIQFSDGDNLTSDCVKVVKLLKEDILPKIRYFKYVEANRLNRHSTLIDSSYSKLNDDNFSYVVIREKDDALKGIRFGEELDKLKS